MKYLIYLLLALPALAFGTLNEVDKQLLAAKNLLRNGGFENGKAGTSATGGTYTLITNDIINNGINGRVTASWDASAADQYLNFGTITYYRWSPVAQKNGIALCSFRSGYSDYTLEVYDGTNVIASQVLSTGGSTSLTKKEFVNFAFPTTTLDSAMTITVRLKSTADATTVLVDDCFLGLADEVNLTNVSQAQFIGSAYIPVTANCLWSRSNTAIGAFTSDADCPGPTVEVNPGPGTIQTTDADLPQFTVNNLPPGTYQVMISGPGIPTGSNAYVAYAIYDGTDTRGEQGGASSLTTMTGPFSIVGTFTYSSAGNRTFAVHGRASANTVNIDPRSHRVHFSIYKFPSSTELAYRPDAMANSWSGYHDNTCSWSRTNTAFGDPTADATCSFSEITNQNFGTVASHTSGGNNLPGIVFTPKKAGKYFVCAHFFMDSSATVGKNILTDGSVTIASGGNPGSTIPLHNMLCGIVTASSTSSKTVAIQTASTSGSTTVGSASYARSVDWNIFAIDQQLPAPLLVNSVTSNSSGVEGIHRAFITNTGTPTISSGDQSGDWIDSITDGAAGVVKVNFKAGVFSRKPACTAMCIHNGTNCTVFAYNNTVEPSTTAIELVSRNSAGTGVDEDIMLICMGPR